MKKLFTGVTAVLMALLPALALAHEGHGVPGSMAHELHHVSWFIFAAMALAAAVFLIIVRVNEDKDEE